MLADMFNSVIPCLLFILTSVQASVLVNQATEANAIQANLATDGPHPLVCRRDQNVTNVPTTILEASATPPLPFRTYCVWEMGNVCNSEEFDRNNGAIYLGQDMDLGTDSFSIFAHIRLRPRSGSDNWGGRILSKRTSYKTGWQFVVPSFYGRKVSMYMNDNPGHITYGEAVIPNYTWLTVAITVNRDDFRQSNLATVNAYLNGLPDGSPYIVQLDGTLSTPAPLTIGHWMYEDNTYHVGRKDWRSPTRQRHVHRFYGDISDLTVWKQALTPEQILHYSESIVAKNVVSRAEAAPVCQPGWRPFGCKCYKLFPSPLRYDTAWTTCVREEGRLVVVDSPAIQDFVWGLVVPSSDQDFWIGLNDTTNESIWRFSNGYNLNYFIGQWNNFKNNFPDKEYKTDDCAEVKKIYAGKWNDANCNKFNPFICERGPRVCG
ncbi:uncharacterized protein LOC144748809 [Ciona intestinalis]